MRPRHPYNGTALQSPHALDSIGPQSRSPEPRQMMTSCVGASVDIDGRNQEETWIFSSRAGGA
eukprot:5805220-Prymnesium_polylepis.1